MRGCQERALGTIRVDAAGVGCFQDLVEIFTEMEEVVFFEDRFPCIREWSHVVENPIIHATSGGCVGDGLDVISKNIFTPIKIYVGKI